jgi:hypothetical protein
MGKDKKKDKKKQGKGAEKTAAKTAKKAAKREAKGRKKDGIDEEDIEVDFCCHGPPSARRYCRIAAIEPCKNPHALPHACRRRRLTTGATPLFLQLIVQRLDAEAAARIAVVEASSPPTIHPSPLVLADAPCPPSRCVPHCPRLKKTQTRFPIHHPC